MSNNDDRMGKTHQTYWLLKREDKWTRSDSKTRKEYIAGLLSDGCVITTPNIESAKHFTTREHADRVLDKVTAYYGDSKTFCIMEVAYSLENTF